MYQLLLLLSDCGYRFCSSQLSNCLFSDFVNLTCLKLFIFQICSRDFSSLMTLQVFEITYLFELKPFLTLVLWSRGYNTRSGSSFFCNTCKAKTNCIASKTIKFNLVSWGACNCIQCYQAPS